MRKSAKVCVFLFLSIIWALALNDAFAQEVYWVETSVGYSQLEENDHFESKTYVLAANIHFNPVDVAGHPLAEAAFLERIGSVQLAGGIVEYDFGFGIEAEGSPYAVRATYAQPEQPVYASAFFLTADSDFDPPFYGEILQDEFGVGIGIFLKDGLLVGFEYGHLKGDLSIDGILTEELEKDKFGIGTKWVHEMGKGTAVNLEGSVGIEDTDDGDDGSNTIVEVAGDFYVNPRASIGAGFALNTGDYEDDEGKEFEGRFRVFVNPHFSLGASVTIFLAENDNVNDTQSIGVTLSFRF